MKKILALALATASVLSAANAIASTTHTVAVSATVTGTCRFNAASGATLAFGTIDPTGAVPVTASGTATYRCNNGTSPTVTTDDGLSETGANAPRMRAGATANYLPYTFTIAALAAGTGLGNAPANDKTLTINGSVAVADFQAAAAGTFNDTITLTIAP